MKFKKNVRKSPIILLKSGQTVTMDTRLYNHKNETRLKDYSNKGKGKTVDHGNQQQTKQKCPMEDCNHGN